MMRRAALIAGVTVLTIVTSAGIASAGELDDYLAEAADASYAGQQATWCSYGGKTEFSIVSVEHTGHAVMVEAAGSSQILTGGRASANGAENGLALANWSSVPVADRYVVASSSSEARVGRKVTVVTVNEQDRMRARIWFDEATGAALGSEVYGGDGELFRLSWMIDFDANPRRIYEALREEDSIYDVVLAADTEGLAAEVAGYQLVDAYAGPSDSLHSFYSDGLFSFSLFTMSGEGVPGPFEKAEMMKVESGSYRWILTSSDLWAQWSGGNMTYVLVGDLPPDHLENVLAELPAPGSKNFLSRIWTGIFG